MTAYLRFKSVITAGLVVCLVGLAGCFGGARNRISTGLDFGSQKYTSGTTEAGTQLSVSSINVLLRFNYSSYMLDSRFGGDFFTTRNIYDSEETVNVKGGTDARGSTWREEMGIGWMYQVPDISFGEADILFGLWGHGLLFESAGNSMSYEPGGLSVGARARFYLDPESNSNTDVGNESLVNTGWFIAPELRILVPWLSRSEVKYEDALGTETDRETISSFFVTRIGVGVFNKIDNVSFGLGFNLLFAKMGKADFPDDGITFPESDFSSQEFFLYVIIDL